MTAAASLTLRIARVALRLEAAPEVCDAMAARFRPFLVSSERAAATLSVQAATPFQPALEQEASLVAQACSPTGIAFSGAATGAFDVQTRRGHVEGARGLGAVDALVRAALSLLLPAEGALLVHGALVADAASARVFAGASGAGKSTVAQALSAVCDELTVLDLEGDGDRVIAHGTPYWQGSPVALPLDAIVCLRRAGAGSPSVEPLRGARAVRALAGNLVRYASVPVIEPRLFALAAQACERARVLDAACPEGAAFLPFVCAHFCDGRRAA